MKIDPARLDAANRVLATFRRPHQVVAITLDERRLFLDGPEWCELARLRGDGLWFANRKIHNRMGGTEEQAAAQLVRWLRNLPRRGRPWWGYSTSPTVALGDAATLRILEDAGYFDPAKIGCVLCGAEGAADWWSLDRVTGPCCFGGRCRDEAMTKRRMAMGSD